MLNWFRSRKKSFLSAWNIDDIPGFEKINNSDSIQYVNTDQSRIIYFSVLTVSGNNRSPLLNYDNSATVIKESDTWLLKGTKTHKNLVLICAITVRHEADVEWAKRYFAFIKPN